MQIELFGNGLDKTPAVSIDHKMTLEDACTQMNSAGVGVVAVMQDGEVCGILREMDVIRHASQQGGFATTPVTAVMCQKVS